MSAPRARWPRLSIASRERSPGPSRHRHPARFRARSQVTSDSLAYEYNLLAQYHWNRFTELDLRRSLAYSDSAIARDPAYVNAWLGRANALFALASGMGADDRTGDAGPSSPGAGHCPGAGSEVRARPRPARLHVHQLEWDWDAADREFRQAFALEPKAALTYARAAFLQTVRGNTDSALALAAMAQRLEPTNIRIVWRPMGVLRPALPAEPRHGPAGLAARSLFLRRAADRGALAQRAWPPRRGHCARRVVRAQTPLRSCVDPRHRTGTGRQPRGCPRGPRRLLKHGRPGSRSMPHTCSGHTPRWVTPTGCLPGLIAQSPSGRSVVAYLYVDPLLDRYRADPRFKAAIRGPGLPPQ